MSSSSNNNRDNPSSRPGPSSASFASGQQQSAGGDGGSNTFLSSIVPRPPRHQQQQQQRFQQQNKTATATMLPVLVNYFRMRYRDRLRLFQYSVHYSILMEDGRRRPIGQRLDENAPVSPRMKFANRARFWRFVELNPQFFRNVFGLAYDDAHILYSTVELPVEGNGKMKEFEMSKQAATAEEGPQRPILMRVKFARQLTVRFDDPTNNDFRTICTLVLTQRARCPPMIGPESVVHCECDRFYLKTPVPFHRPLDLGGFQLLRGISVAPKRGQNGQAFANFDVVHSAFFKVGIDVMQFYVFAKTGKFMNADVVEPKLRDYGMNHNQRDELRQLLRGLRLKKKAVAHGIVEMEHTFCDVVDKTAHSFRFDSREFGANISVFEYYQRRYGYRVRFPTMPLIQLQPQHKRIVVPMEVLRVADRWQRLCRKLPEQLQTRALQEATLLPARRFTFISEMLGEGGCLLADDPFMDQFGLGVANEFEEVQAKVLPSPNCEFSASNTMRLRAVEGPTLEGATNVERVQLPLILDLFIVDNPCIGHHKACWEVLIGSCRRRGIDFLQGYANPLQLTVLNPFDPTTVAASIEARAEHLKRFEKSKTAIPMIIVLLPQKRSTEIYAAFKGLCELRFGIRSQMIKTDVFRKLGLPYMDPDRPTVANQLARNIFLKMNAKCGGVNCRIAATAPGNSKWAKFVDRQSPTLFVGIYYMCNADHPLSIVSMVGNIDLDGTRYTATVRAQYGRMGHLIDSRIVEEMFIERLRHFTKGTGIFNGQRLNPARVIVFRFGICDSQFDAVRLDECKAMRQAFNKHYEGITQGTTQWRPKLTVLVLQRRHGTRFAIRGKDKKDIKGNVPPGTVVDSHIVADPNKEFFLTSHKGILGTSRPAHYFKLVDDNGFTADETQMCCNNLCYLFARAPGPVSVPAPVYYAQLACQRARHHYAAASGGYPVGRNVDRRMLRAEEAERVEPLNEAVEVHGDLKATMYWQ